MPSESLISAIVNLATSDHSFVKVLFWTGGIFGENIPYYGELAFLANEPAFTILPGAMVQNVKAEDSNRQDLKGIFQLLETAFTQAAIKFTFFGEGRISGEHIKGKRLCRPDHR